MMEEMRNYEANPLLAGVDEADRSSIGATTYVPATTRHNPNQNMMSTYEQYLATASHLRDKGTIQVGNEVCLEPDELEIMNRFATLRENQRLKGPF